MKPIVSNTSDYVALQDKELIHRITSWIVFTVLVEISENLNEDVTPLSSIADIGCGSGPSIPTAERYRYFRRKLHRDRC